jgi:RNA polymerase sigma factor (sigma-70 family)
MADRPEIGREDAGHLAAPMPSCGVTDAWFIREVLPLEAALMQFLRRNWRNGSDVADLRQEVYVRVYEAARRQIPGSARPFVFTTARNLLINLVRRERIVPIEAIGELDTLRVASDEAGPDRTVMAREELRRLQSALDQLPPRCREAIVLRQVEGLSQREIASRMDISEKTVERHLSIGVRALADMLTLADTLYGGQSQEQP